MVPDGVMIASRVLVVSVVSIAVRAVFTLAARSVWYCASVAGLVRSIAWLSISSCWPYFSASSACAAL